MPFENSFHTFIMSIIGVEFFFFIFHLVIDVSHKDNENQIILVLLQTVKFRLLFNYAFAVYVLNIDVGRAWHFQEAHNLFSMATNHIIITNNNNNSSEVL